MKARPLILESAITERFLHKHEIQLQGVDITAQYHFLQRESFLIFQV